MERKDERFFTSSEAVVQMLIALTSFLAEISNNYVSQVVGELRQYMKA